jgi:hypothetical protein
MKAGRTFKSLEEPANYYGTHVTVALGAILLPVASLLGFLWLDWLIAFGVVAGSLALSGAVFAIGAWLGKDDPYWPEAGLVHLLEEQDYLDV